MLVERRMVIMLPCVYICVFSLAGKSHNNQMRLRWYICTDVMMLNATLCCNMPFRLGLPHLRPAGGGHYKSVYYSTVA